MSERTEMLVRPSEALWRIGCVPAEYLLRADENGMVDLADWVDSDAPATLPRFRVARAAS